MKPGKADEAAPEGRKQQPKADKRKPKEDERKREDQSGKPLTEEQRADEEEMERRQREEYEARAEERRLKAEEERRRAEEERQRAEQMRKQREAKLKGAFAVGGDPEDDDEEDREAQLARRASGRKREVADPGARGLLQQALEVPATVAVMQGPRTAPVDPELSAKLRFEPGLDPAEAFMRLQERKRKGRRAEFGGPPRGCSPWRDGKRGVTWARQDDEQRQ